MYDAIEAVRADRASLLEICDQLKVDQWQAASGCAGWRIQDVVTHMSNLFWLVVDPQKLPDISGLPTEAAQEALVQARRELEPAEVLADYEEVSKVAVDRLADLAKLDLELELGDLGSYRANVLPTAYAFDHYTHIRADMFGPRGPLTGPPPSDELRIGSALDWVEAALAQQNPAVAADIALELQITGTGARVISFGTGGAMATVCSDGPTLVRWVTQRGSWEELGVQASGDQRAISAARQLKVF